MGNTKKIEVRCPHCDKKKMKIHFSDEKGVQHADREWFPLLQSIGESAWDNDSAQGIALECKCKRAFFVHNLNTEGIEPEVLPQLKPGFSVAWFCKKCGASFMGQDMTCPGCGTVY
jgi:hypothetical protein